MSVFLANFLPLYLRIYFLIFIFQFSCIRWVTLGCDRRTPVPTRPCPYNPSYQLCPLLTQPPTFASSWLTVQFACSTVALACTRVTIPVISWPNTRDLMYEHHTVQCMPRTQAEYQHIAGDVEALTPKFHNNIICHHIECLCHQLYLQFQEMYVVRPIFHFITLYSLNLIYS